MLFLKKLVVVLFTVTKQLLNYSFFISSIALVVSYYASYIRPDAFILLPLLTLLFPALLILNVFWIIFFAVGLQYKKLFFSVLIQLFFLPQIKNYYGLHWSAPLQENPSDLSLLTYNIRLFDLYNWQSNYQTREKIFQYLEKHPADIMCFQEFYTSEDSNDFNNLNELKKRFPDYYFHTEYLVTLRKNDHWGLLTMSKYPILEKTMIHFNNAKNNGCLITKILYQQDTIQIANLHLQSYSFFKKKKWRPHQPPDNDSFIEALDTSAKGFNFIQKIYYTNALKLQQFESIFKIICQSRYPTLLLGDFNDIPNSYIIRQIREKGFTDAFTIKGQGFGFTYHDKLKLRIDYIFYDQHFKIQNFSTEDKNNTQHLSDHFPVRAVLQYLHKDTMAL